METPQQNPQRDPRSGPWEPSERQNSSESLAEGCAPRTVTLRKFKKYVCVIDGIDRLATKCCPVVATMCCSVLLLTPRDVATIILNNVGDDAAESCLLLRPKPPFTGVFGPSGSKLRKSQKRFFLGGLQKSPPKYPKKSRNTQKPWKPLNSLISGSRPSWPYFPSDY